MRWQSFFLPCLLLGNWYTKWKCSWNTRTHDEIKPKQNKTRDINFDYFIGIIERVNRSIPSILMRFDLICLCGGKTCLNDLNVIGEVHCTYFLFPSKWAHAYNTHYTCSLTAFYSPIFRIAQIFITHLKNSEKLPKWTVHSPSLHLSITKWHCNPTWQWRRNYYTKTVYYIFIHFDGVEVVAIGKKTFAVVVVVVMHFVNDESKLIGGNRCKQ